MKIINGSEARATVLGDVEAGNILVPCLFILSLISLLTLGVLNIGGVGTSVSSALSEKSQASLAAQSGIEIAYERLATNAGYTGETCSPLDDASCKLDIAVKPLGNSEFEVLSRANVGESESVVRTRVRTQPWLSEYPLSIGGDLRMYGDARILGDTFVSQLVTGKPHTSFSGDMYLEGERKVLYDEHGNPIQIDGLEIPTIFGRVRTQVKGVKFPTVQLDKLRAMAQAQGQYFTKTMHFTDRDFKGVLYFENPIARPFFENVTIDGVLVCNDVAEIRVEAGFLKIRSNDALCPNVALLAPGSNLWVDPHGMLDVYGLSYVYTTDFQGKATFTGPVMSMGELYARPDSLIYLQFPTEMDHFLSDLFEWSDLRVIELEYEEL